MAVAVGGFFVSGSWRFSFPSFELGSVFAIVFKKFIQQVHVFGDRGDIAIHSQSATQKGSLLLKNNFRRV